MADYDRHGWLAQTVEQAIDPDQRILDPHHHLWERNGATYLAAELSADATTSHNVTDTVFVECMSGYDDGPEHLAPVGETRFVAAQAAETQRLGGPTIGAIVGHADLRLGTAVNEVLIAHEQAGGGLFRGIRHGTNVSSHPDVKTGHHAPIPGLMGDATFRQGLATLADMGYSFDAWLYFDQLDELADMARAVPHCPIVLDHLGGPLGVGGYAVMRDQMIAHWRAAMTEVATCPNVVLKIGGIGMEHYFGNDWSMQPRPPGSEEVASYWADMVRWAIDAFSPERCMFESNFPVDRQTLPYTVLWNAFQILGSQYDEEERAALFFGTGAKAYRIDPAPDRDH